MLSLQACVEQKTTVLEQASQGTVAANGVAPSRPPPPPPVRHLSPCSAPAGSGPFESAQGLLNPHSIKIVWSPEAIAANIHGCAGVRFRIGPDGVPQDVSVLTEYPVGYGLGDSILQAFPALRWTPRNDLAWHFVVINHNPQGPQHI
jgi:hypothetical protein